MKRARGRGRNAAGSWKITQYSYLWNREDSQCTISQTYCGVRCRCVWTKGFGLNLAVLPIGRDDVSGGREGVIDMPFRVETRVSTRSGLTRIDVHWDAD